MITTAILHEHWPHVRREPLNTGIELLTPEARAELRRRLEAHLDNRDPVLAAAAAELVGQIDALGRDECPTVAVTIVHGRECWLLEFLCPWCHRVHTHGGGPLDGTPDAGHRVSHCHAPGTPSGYELVIVGEEAGR